ncbi:MAG: FkbM family methyltransferase [Bacteroidota bacterium]|jgi:FkbM family methyltransferase
MKKVIRKIILKILYPIIKWLGFVRPHQIHTYDKNNLLLTLIRILKENKFSPNLIIDIGANHGTWSRVWKEHFPQTSFILVEPQSWLKPSFDDLLDNHTIYLPIGAGSTNGSFTFTINSDRDDSSTFTLSADEALARGYKQVEIPVKTLNTIVQENGNIIPDIVKIDAEGIDIDVLDGASNLFGKTEIFLVEASINSTFKQTELTAVINYMDNKGYRVFEITDINRPFSNSVLWLIELAFVRKGGYFDQLKWY